MPGPQGCPSPSPCSPLLPVLAVGAGTRNPSPLLPRLNLSGQRLLHLELDLGRAEAADGQVVARHVLHSQLLLAWGGKGGVRLCPSIPRGGRAAPTHRCPTRPSMLLVRVLPKPSGSGWLEERPPVCGTGHPRSRHPQPCMQHCHGPRAPPRAGPQAGPVSPFFLNILCGFSKFSV